MSETTPWYLREYGKALTNTSRLLGKVELALLEENAEKQGHRDTVHLHPSEMAKENWCPRQSWYKIKGTETSNPESFAFHRLNIFAEGDAIHSKWQRWMHKAGLLEGDWACLACKHKWWDKSPKHCPSCYEDSIVYKEIQIWNEQYKIMGHADGLIEDANGKALIEIKSVGLGTIRFDAPALHSAYEKGDISLDELWKRIKRPLAAHNRQIQLYMYCTGIHNAIVLYEWKPTQATREFELSYEESTVAPILQNAQLVLDSLEEDVIPPRPTSATNKSCQTCNYCPFKDLCWKVKT